MRSRAKKMEAEVSDLFSAFLSGCFMLLLCSWLDWDVENKELPMEGKEKPGKWKKKGKTETASQQGLEGSGRWGSGQGERWERQRDWDSMELWEESWVKKFLGIFPVCHILKFFLCNFFKRVLKIKGIFSKHLGVRLEFLLDALPFRDKS